MPNDPKAAKRSEPKEFLIVALPDNASVGATLRLLGFRQSLSAAEKAIAELDAGTLGRVAVLERKVLYVRRPAVENVAVAEPIASE